MSVETIRRIESAPASPEADHNLELSEEAVNARFAEIIEAEENIAAGDPVERERRTQITNYKPSEGYDRNQMKAAGYTMQA